MTSHLTISMVNDGGNLICDTVGLSKDMLNNHRDRKAEKASNIVKD